MYTYFGDMCLKFVNLRSELPKQLDGAVLGGGGHTELVLP